MNQLRSHVTLRNLSTKAHRLPEPDTGRLAGLQTFAYVAVLAQPLAGVQSMRSSLPRFAGDLAYDDFAAFAGHDGRRRRCRTRDHCQGLASLT